MSRPKRFLVNVRLGERIETAFLPHTGRLEGILVKGARLLLREVPNRVRVPYDIVIAFDGKVPVVVDSRIPNAVIKEAIMQRKLPQLSLYTQIKAEIKVCDSRLDFMLQNTDVYYLEVKGCTMARNSLSLYPDAPTERGVRHLELLTKLHLNGYRTGVWFVAMRSDTLGLMINRQIDPLFFNKLKEANKLGVEVYAYSISLKNYNVCHLGKQISINIA
ncbi:MAG: DNA/RNA nuclease SfsA [Nitrososphaerota archaeon]|nr:DNA/RNA nuclease SfsA [Nitrososphaerota archaeon]